MSTLLLLIMSAFSSRLFLCMKHTVLLLIWGSGSLWQEQNEARAFMPQFSPYSTTDWKCLFFSTQSQIALWPLFLHLCVSLVCIFFSTLKIPVMVRHKCPLHKLVGFTPLIMVLFREVVEPSESWPNWKQWGGPWTWG